MNETDPQAPRLIRFVALAASAAVFAGACTSTADDPAVSSSTTAASASSSMPTSTSVAEPAAIATTLPGGGATDVGVTADTIKLGVFMADGEALEALGIEASGREHEREMWAEAAAAVNDRGGIQGRQIELVYAAYLPVGVVQAEAACLELAEDQQVFAAVGQVRPPEAALCFSEQQQVPFLAAGEGFSAAVVDRSRVAAINTQPHLPDLDQAIVTMAEADAALAGAAIAIHGRDENRMNAVEESLGDLGYQATARTVLTTPETDPNAIASEYDAVVERWRADDIDVVLNVGASIDVLMVMAARELYPSVYATSSDAYTFTPVEEADFEAMRHFVFASGVPDPGPDHEPSATCVDRWNTSHPEAAVTWEDGWLVRHTCSVLELFEIIATEAGPDLTRAAFTDAIGAADGAEVTGVGTVSLGPDDTSAAAATVRNEFDEDTQAFTGTVDVPLG